MPLAIPSPRCVRRRRRRHERRRPPLWRLALAVTCCALAVASACVASAPPGRSSTPTSATPGGRSRPCPDLRPAPRPGPGPVTRASGPQGATPAGGGAGQVTVLGDRRAATALPAGTRPLRRPGPLGEPERRPSGIVEHGPPDRPRLVGRRAAASAVPPGPAAGGTPTGVGARSAPPAAGEAVVDYIPPVDAPVVDPFRPPSLPWASGNRGLAYDTAPGDLVWASADGTVTFAGQVGGQLHVTVEHADGLRTGYSFLGSVEVTLGQAVRQGDTLGRAGDAFHFGARVGPAYVDPAALFDAGATVVELLPYEVPPGSSPESEAAVIDEMFSRSGGLSGLADDISGAADHLGGLEAAYDWLHERADGLADVLGDYSLPGRAMRAAFDLGERVFFHGPCSDGAPPRAPVAGQQRVAIAVGGLGSSGDGGDIDDLRAGDLGYGADDLLRFSYAGGVTPGTAGNADRFGVEANAYAPADTQGDLRQAADRLADLVEQVVEDDPGVTVDLYAHSQGGLVTRLALTRLAERGVPLDRLGLVATLATPHLGADLATSLQMVSEQDSGALAVDVGAEVSGLSVDPNSTAVGQLAEGSDVVDELADAGVPDGVHLVSVAARGDMMVASPQADVEGATNVVVPVGGLGAHGDIVGSDAATGELARALAGEPPACEGVGDAVRDVVTGHAISATEDNVGLLGARYLP